VAHVPVVDISADPQSVGAELDEICRTAGFFQVTGHGVPGDVAGDAWRAATGFFDLPLADKMSVARPTEDYPYGYIPMTGESLSRSVAGSAPPDLKEVFNAGPPAAAHPVTGPGSNWSYSPSLWPLALPDLQIAWTVYYAALRELGGRLMSLLARGLGLPPGYFTQLIDQSPDALRAINYPARDTPPLPGQLRAGAHTDYGTLTILRQDEVGGLEVLGGDGGWTGVEPVPGAFVVNLGDLMARWTNDRWRSTLHRVVDPPGAMARRQSMPYFQNANWTAEISCLPTCLAPGERPRYKPVLAGPHLMGKFRRSVAVASEPGRDDRD